MLFHHQILLGTFFSTLKVTADYIEVSSNVENEPMWEYIMPLTEDFIDSSVLYGRNIYTPKRLPSDRYRLKYTDAWLGCIIPEDIQPAIFSDFKIIEVKTEADMLMFLEGFFQAYSGHQEEDPYGALPRGYWDTFLSSFKSRKSQLKYFYIVGDDNKVAAVSAIGIKKPYSFLYCLGVVPSFRGRSLFKLLQQHRLYYARHQHGCNFAVLQTEQGGFTEKFLKNGFSLIEVMHCYESL